MTATRLTLAAAFMTALAGCEISPDDLRSALPPGDPQALMPVGSRWTVARIEDHTLPEANGIALMREPAAISGATGCNQFRAGLRVEGAAMTLAPLRASSRPCLGAAALHEAALLGALTRIDGVAQDAFGRVVLTRGGLASVVLVPIIPAPR